LWLAVAANAESRAPGARCAGCHPQVAANYSRTGMARSFTAALDRLPIWPPGGRASFEHPASRSFYALYRRDRSVYLRRHQIGFDGRETNVLEARVDYSLGSGNHAQGLIYRAPDGRLMQLPIAWYAEDRAWAMAPGYDRPDHADFRRAVDGACMFCHNASPAEGIIETPGADPVFPAELPEGIDCERCHGPAGEHIENAQRGADRALVRAAILNPARLTPERQLEICMQCHLQPTSQLLPAFLRRPERATFSYDPRQPLGSYMRFFDRAAPDPSSFEVNHTAYRLRESACFRRSAGRMVCTTCHDPHEPANAARANRACGACHRELPRSHTAEANCVACHMQKRRTNDAVHVIMTDHRIARFALPDLRPKTEAHEDTYRGKVAPYYPARAETSDDKLMLGLAQVRDGADLAGGIPRLERLTGQHPDAPVAYLYGLAEAYRNSSQPARAALVYRLVLERDPAFAPAWLGLGQALAAGPAPSEAAGVLEQALTQSAPLVAVLNLLGSVYQQAGDLARSQSVLQRAISVAPELPEPYLNLGVTRARQADPAGAATAFREAIRMAPGLAAAHNNLAYLLASIGRSREAEFHFREALQLDPGYWAAHLGYARLLAARGQRDEAAAHFRQAARSPDAAMRREAVDALQQ
jgi:tetratricopeptide (TPR) repeat protein